MQSKINISKLKNNKIIKIISIILLSFFVLNIFFTNIVRADEWVCGNKNNEDRYKCQVKTFCEIYKEEEISYKSKDYFEDDKTWEENLFTTAKKKYRENQNSIYACSIIKLQKNSYKVIKDKLINIDKWWTLKSRINQKFNLKIKKLDRVSKERQCISPSNKEENNSLQLKKNLLNESVYELCKYNFYLNFLQNHYKNINNANQEYLWKNNKSNSFKISEIAKIQSKLQQDLVDEIEHSKNIFNMAFNTYIDYENNYPVHILLELIKEDFIVLRRKLHEALSPINQVVYKISNAMNY